MQRYVGTGFFPSAFLADIQTDVIGKMNPPTPTTEPVILLTGRPGIGKSTIVQRVTEKLAGQVGGFFTREIRVGKRRTGFEIVTLSGEQMQLAARTSKSTFAHEADFGPFKINLDAIHKVAIPAMQRAAAAGQIVVIDEIGPMEILSPAFQKAVLEVLANPRLKVFGTVVYRPWVFADDLKRHPRVSLLTVTPGNRDQLPAEVLRLLTTDTALQEKMDKARIYVTQRERFTLNELRLTMTSEHGLRQITFREGVWACTCDFYQQRGTCSHIMAAQELLKAMMGDCSPGVQAPD